MMQWSVMRYDLRTALDVLGLPCHVRLADEQLSADDDYRILNIDDDNNRDYRQHHHLPGYTNRKGETPSMIVKLDKRLCTCHVRARVLDVDDVEWFIMKKGLEYYKQRSHYVNKEILISLDCSSKVRVRDKGAGKLYTTIREVAVDFPRYVQAEQDTVCLSGQVVTKGTILELDRIAQDAKSVRGFRERFLICRDKTNSRELAFRLMSTCKFSKMCDITSYRVKDLIERLPLPQTIDFLVSNPYEIISASDLEAMELLTILSGPLELLGLKMQEYVVGQAVDRDLVVGFPYQENYIEQVLVNIPVSKTGSIRDSNCDVFDDVDYEAVIDKLYLLYADRPCRLMLKRNIECMLEYDMIEDPDPPPIPQRKSGLSRNLTFSGADDNDVNLQRNRRPVRKRFSSASDLEKKRISQKIQRQEFQSRSLKNYLNQFSRKVKTTASHFFLGRDGSQFTQDTTCNTMTSAQKNVLTRSQPSLPDIKEVDGTNSDTDSGFICYIQIDAESREDRPSSDSVLSCPRFRQSCSLLETSNSAHYNDVTLSTRTECFQNASNTVREYCGRMSGQVYGKAMNDKEYLYSTVSKVRTFTGVSRSVNSKAKSDSNVTSQELDDDVFTTSPNAESNANREIKSYSYDNSKFYVPSVPNGLPTLRDQASEHEQSVERDKGDDAVNKDVVESETVADDWKRVKSGRASGGCVYSTLIHRDDIPSLYSENQEFDPNYEDIYTVINTTNKTNDSNDISNDVTHDTNNSPASMSNESCDNWPSDNLTEMGYNSFPSNNTGNNRINKNKTGNESNHGNTNQNKDDTGLDDKNKDNEEVTYATIRRPKGRYIRGRCCEVCREVFNYYNYTQQT